MSSVRGSTAASSGSRIATVTFTSVLQPEYDRISLSEVNGAGEFFFSTLLDRLMIANFFNPGFSSTEVRVGTNRSSARVFFSENTQHRIILHAKAENGSKKND